jgi:hypothetical protein
MSHIEHFTRGEMLIRHGFDCFRNITKTYCIFNPMVPNVLNGRIHNNDEGRY